MAKLTDFTINIKIQAQPGVLAKKLIINLYGAIEKTKDQLGEESIGKAEISIEESFV